MKELFSFFNLLDEVVYVSDIETYELIYINKRGLEIYRLQNEKDYIGKKCYEVLQQRRPKVNILVDQPQLFTNNPATLHNYHSPRHTKKAENRRLTPVFGPLFVPRRPWAALQRFNRA